MLFAWRRATGGVLETSDAPAPAKGADKVTRLLDKASLFVQPGGRGPGKIPASSAKHCGDPEDREWAEMAQAKKRLAVYHDYCYTWYTLRKGDAMLPFTIKFQDGIPAAEQLLLAVRKAMLTGQLRAGDAFPSVRTLSQELRISPTTAHKVVLQLKADGLLASQPGVGMVITAPVQATVSDRQEQIGPACERLLEEAADLGLTLEQVIATLRRTKTPARELLDAGEKAKGRGR
jgi:GntR family transcriptional regulator